jgi:hypothetical protein
MNVMIDGIRYVPELAQSKDEGLQTALEARFSSGAGADLSVREYLRLLLMGVWDEGECFDGKRPFGYSDWESDIYDPLVKAGFMAGTIDREGYAVVSDATSAHAYVCDLILAMCHGAAPSPDS